MTLGFRVVVVNPSLATSDDVKNSSCFTKIKSLQHGLAPSHSSGLLLLGQAMGYPPGTSLAHLQMLIQDLIERRRSNAHLILNLATCHPGIFKYHALYQVNVFLDHGGGGSPTSRTVFKARPIPLKFCEPVKKQSCEMAQSWGSRIEGVEAIPVVLNLPYNRSIS